jgi:hypothetical protein
MEFQPVALCGQMKSGSFCTRPSGHDGWHFDQDTNLSWQPVLLKVEQN